MLPGLGEDRSTWEQTKLALIAKDNHLLGSFQALKYTEIALLTILLYDHCLTFNLEKRRIWTLSWKLPKYLFMFNRYILPPVFFFQVFCSQYNDSGTQIVYTTFCQTCNARIYTQIPSGAAVMTVELMLTLRVLALYGNSTGLARFLVIQLLVLWITGVSFFAGVTLLKTRAIVGHDIFTGCLYDMPSWTSLTWIPLLVLESILAILTAYKCRKYGEFSPTIKILARDSAIYHICIFSVLMFSIVYSLWYKLIGLAMTFPTAILASIIASRISMNIRALTVERGITTLAHQSRPSALFSFSIHSGRNRHNAGVGEVGASSVDAISSPTGIQVPARQEEELEGGYYDDEDNNAWFEERDEDQEIIQEDRSMTRREDVERALSF